MESILFAGDELKVDRVEIDLVVASENVAIQVVPYLNHLYLILRYGDRVLEPIQILVVASIVVRQELVVAMRRIQLGEKDAMAEMFHSRPGRSQDSIAYDLAGDLGRRIMKIALVVVFIAKIQPLVQ